MDYTAAKLFILKKLENDLSGQLTYHGKHHTEDVLKVAKELCNLENISHYESILIKTASLFHDSGFLKSMTEHEKHSCELARKYLPDFGYTEDEIKRICEMIMATKIPQSPKNQLEEIICDADLDYLGRDDFYTIGNTLFEELKSQGKVDDVYSWNEIQINFLQEHKFFTPTNINRRTAKKQNYLKELIEINSKGNNKKSL